MNKLIKLLFTILCICSVLNINAQVQIGSNINGEVANDQSGNAVSMPDANTIAIGAYLNDGSFVNAGHVRIYAWNGIDWIQKGLDIDGEDPNDQFGYAVSMPDANTVAIGAYQNDGNGSNSGHVRIYTWNGTTWVQKGMDIDGEAANDLSGRAISMPDANTVAIGAYQNDGNGSNSGHVRIYTWNGSAWIQKGIDIDGEASGDQSGYSINMPDENTIAIGANLNDGTGIDAGHVRIYSWNGSTWVQKGIDLDGEEVDDYFGIFVSMANSNTIAIGAYRNDDNGSEAGHARVYNWNGSAWIQIGMDIDGEAAGDYCGIAVSMGDSNIVAVAANGNDGNGIDAGHVRIYGIKGIYGYTYLDFNQNCVQNTLEDGLANITLTLNPGNIVLQTNSNGSWVIDSLPIGTYTLTADTNSQNWQLTCPVTRSFTIIDPNSAFLAPSFGYISNYPCSAPNVSINAPFLRPGFSNQAVYVQACNNSTASAILNNAYTIVELPSLLTVNSCSRPYTNLGNNQYQVNLGNLYPGQCVNFSFSCTLSSTAVLGQTLCMNAELYPVDSCALDSVPSPFPTSINPCNTPYDFSDLVIRPACNNDTISFVIENTGDGDMTCFSQVRLYIDGVLILIDSVQLASGASISFDYLGDGRTWRLEVDQHPLHYGNSQPSATIELCGNPANWTSNLVNILPQDDADPVIDIYCGLVTGSYDPNDKTGYPLGVGNQYDISPNQDLEYVIRFQNTGTDTAFTVVIRDTLSTDLDIFSVRSGVSSHNYTFRMYGPRVLEWTFNNIMLPDSNINEPRSHGFTTFKVKQVPNLPNGTVLQNSASIYFDFNAPIFTNTSWHTINDNISVLTTIPTINSITTPIKIYPNPTNGLLHIDQANNQEINILVIDNLGRVLLQQQTSDRICDLDIQHLSSGIYYVVINNGKELWTQKVVKR